MPRYYRFSGYTTLRADAFETYGKQHPDVSIHIFSGEESELCRELETHKLDIIFLPENTDISEKHQAMEGPLQLARKYRLIGTAQRTHADTGLHTRGQRGRRCQ